jgi:hypothetical protein
MKTMTAAVLLLGTIGANAAEPGQGGQDLGTAKPLALFPAHVVVTVSLPYAGREIDKPLVHVIESRKQMLKKLGERESKRVIANLKRKSLDFDKCVLFVAVASRKATKGRTLRLEVYEYEDMGERIMLAIPSSMADDKIEAAPRDQTSKGSVLVVLAKKSDNVKRIKVTSLRVHRKVKAPRERE